jgi:hypothetical protein
MAIERAASESAKGRAINPADLPTPDNVKSYLTTCVKQYQQAHNLPEDSVKISEVDCTPNASAAVSRAAGDAYHQHSCGLSHSNCKRLDDYQMQLMLLEYQNKRRLMMARGEVDAASAAPKQPNTIPSPEEIRFRHYRLHDHQRELMREALPSKKERPAFSTPGHGGMIPPTMPEPPKPSSEKVMKNPTVEDFQRQNEQAMTNLCLEEYQKQLMGLRCGNNKRDRLQFQPATTETPAVVKDEPRLASVEAHRQRQAWDRTLVGMAPTSSGAPSVPAQAAWNSLSTLANADHLKKRQHRSPIEDYNMQLLLLEQQNRKRLMMARQEQDRADRDAAANAQEDENSKQQAGQDMTLANRRQEKLAGSGVSNAQETEQILEMGSALREQNEHKKSHVSKAVHAESEDDPDTGMWSTDEFDEWSNCEDDLETVDKIKAW